MTASNKADPGMYGRMRDSALDRPRPSTIESSDSVIPHVILMDWLVTNGSVTVLAHVDGTASIYLSSGGGYIGGSQSYPAIRQAALYAMDVAARAILHATPTKDRSLPAPGEVRFYFVNALGVFVSTVLETSLKTGNDPLGPLGGAMQNILTQYRLIYPKPRAPLHP
jgi:hypothetical protein